MSQTFHQNTHGENSTPVQNTGKMNLTVNNSRREGDTIEISGNVRAIGSVGGSNVRSTVYAGCDFENPNTTGIQCLRYHFSHFYCFIGTFDELRKTSVKWEAVKISRIF